MRATPIVVWLAVGLGLVGAIQWTADGAPGLPVAVPAPLASLLPYLAFLAFGLYLALVYRGTPGPALGILGALTALTVAALPLAYQFGLAQRYGLPTDAGAFGALYTGTLARSAAALWVPVAAAASFRRARPLSLRTVSTPARPVPSAAEPPTEPAPFWSPAPTLQPAESASVAYTPDEPGRA